MTVLFTDVGMERVVAAADRDGQDVEEWVRAVLRERWDAEELTAATVVARCTVATRATALPWPRPGMSDRGRGPEVHAEGATGRS
ncbi:hypothetical protein [Streptomyces monomycini]|uniref:hypothetical protein n=1 Tax=Streptomyces monomycini TaxID=371720 RepID=UPI0012FF00A0|nr:hypothetical protein [Streptomyces monomycini]